MRYDWYLILLLLLVFVAGGIALYCILVVLNGDPSAGLLTPRRVGGSWCC